MPTQEQAAEQMKAYVLSCAAIAEAVRDLGEVPSGHLYAQVMGHMDLQTYERIVTTLVNAKLVTSTNHLLKWVGLAKEQP